MIDQPIYVTAYHQSPFGKLKELTVPEIVELAVTGAWESSHREPAQSLQVAGAVRLRSLVVPRTL